MAQAMESICAPITDKVVDGDLLPICGGIEVIHSPGHTPGHIGLFLKKSGLLVGGDALNVGDGKLVGANPAHSLDMELAGASFEKLKGYGAKGVVAYHGGVLRLA
jgi:glyoxylase-like metal-dependent hydrolase (beta-lactamase superfamily II)